jgi:general secretion pathway protein G
MSRKGFTLLEVLVVIVVIAVLASMVFGLMSYIESARISDTEGRVMTLGFEVGGHMAAKGSPPATLEEFTKRLNQPRWMKDGKFVDSWDRPFGYTVNGKKFELWSFGPDGVSGTADDVRYKRN